MSEPFRIPAPEGFSDWESYWAALHERAERLRAEAEETAQREEEQRQARAPHPQEPTGIIPAGAWDSFAVGDEHALFDWALICIRENPNFYGPDRLANDAKGREFRRDTLGLDDPPMPRGSKNHVERPLRAIRLARVIFNELVSVAPGDNRVPCNDKPEQDDLTLCTLDRKSVLAIVRRHADNPLLSPQIKALIGREEQVREQPSREYHDDAAATAIDSEIHAPAPRTPLPRPAVTNDEILEWYEPRLAEYRKLDKIPTEAEDWKAAQLQFGNRARRSLVREVRSEQLGEAARKTGPRGPRR
jgi:hypothetical protein